MSQRIIVTGGSGKVGRYVVEVLLRQGYQVLNLDLKPFPVDTSIEPPHTTIVDLSDGAQVYSALLSHFRLSEPFVPVVPLNTAPDAIVHLAGYARNMIVSDTELFRQNTQAAYNVVEASCRLGIKKIILASTVCVYGVTYADGDVSYPSFPIDENIDCNPMDVYSLSKLVAERTGRTFARRFDVDVYALRIGAVIAPDEYEQAFTRYDSSPQAAKSHGWSYTDARDLGHMCHCCIERNGLGFEIFNATNDESVNRRNIMDLLREVCPETPFTRDLDDHEAPMTNRKARKLLGFRAQHKWQSYYRP
jgi:nucleoside-diphosphate-sugar epimerase